MNFIRQPCLRTTALRSFRTGAVGIPSPQTNFSRRSLATGGPSGPQSSSPKWLLVSIALGFPLTIYLWQRGDTAKPSNKSSGQNSDSNTSAHDEPRAMGSPKGPTSMSAKQEGLSNADTMNPYVNEPGKSKKGEGETETAKVKGTVRTDRPQV